VESVLKETDLNLVSFKDLQRFWLRLRALLLEIFLLPKKTSEELALEVFCERRGY